MSGYSAEVPVMYRVCADERIIYRICAEMLKCTVQMYKLCTEYMQMSKLYNKGVYNINSALAINQ